MTAAEAAGLSDAAGYASSMPLLRRAPTPAMNSRRRIHPSRKDAVG
jgi:hypothetical protein